MKIFIEDLVAKMQGTGETQLPQGATIRFEIGNTTLSCKPTDEGLEIYKVNHDGFEDSKISTVSISSNKVCIR